MIDTKHLEDELKEHGELHIVVEEHDSVIAGSDEDYIGLRLGNVDFDHQKEIIYLDDGTKEHHIDGERIVYFHAPRDFPD